LTFDFHVNKKVLEDVAYVSTKRLRNKIAGYTTHLMKRIQTGPVKGISLKIQEDEREKRLDFVPSKSHVDLESTTEVDQKTFDYLERISPAIVSRLQVAAPVVAAKKQQKK